MQSELLLYLVCSKYSINSNSNSISSLLAQMVKRLPTMREIQGRSLGWEDPLEKEMAMHSSTLV